MTTAHRIIIVCAAILTLNLKHMCRAEAKPSLDDAVCNYVKFFLNELSYNETFDNKKKKSIEDGWNLNETESQMVCQAVFLHALESSNAEDVVKAACSWLYSDRSVDKV